MPPYRVSWSAVRTMAILMNRRIPPFANGPPPQPSRMLGASR